ncbi:hypothetical protein Trydic_g13287 [Trypoxylus dichotomus]
MSEVARNVGCRSIPKKRVMNREHFCKIIFNVYNYLKKNHLGGDTLDVVGGGATQISRGPVEKRLSVE